MKKTIIKLILGGLGANIALSLFVALMFALSGGSYLFGIIFDVIVTLALGASISQIRADIRDKHGIRAAKFFLVWNAPSCALAALLFVLSAVGWTLPINDFVVALAVVLPMLALMLTAPLLLISELIWLAAAVLKKRRSE